MPLTLIVVVVVVVVVVVGVAGSLVLSHDVDGLDILFADMKAHADKALAVLGILVGSGHLKSVLI